MENERLGKIVVSAKIESLHDLFQVRRGDLAEANVRRVEITDALVDTRTFGLSMPLRLIEHLGLEKVRNWMSSTTFWAVRLTIQGRDCVTDVTVIADHLPVIIGRLPLLAMDWVIDPDSQRVIGNPDHGGEEMLDIL